MLNRPGFLLAFCALDRSHGLRPCAILLNVLPTCYRGSLVPTNNQNKLDRLFFSVGPWFPP